MVTDQQVKKLRKFMKSGMKLSLAALKTGMDEKTAWKFLRSGKLPSEGMASRDWRTRPDSFDDAWEWAREFLGEAPGLEAKTLFEALQRQFPGRFPDSQLRTFQRRVKNWRATEGPPREVFFAQKHDPGELSSDFTYMSSLGITIAGQPFDHLIYHFVLTYSNWEESWMEPWPGLKTQSFGSTVRDSVEMTVTYFRRIGYRTSRSTAVL